jgi:hypothetical protein
MITYNGGENYEQKPKRPLESNWFQKFSVKLHFVFTFFLLCTNFFAVNNENGTTRFFFTISSKMTSKTGN